jgi:hypothetical protein
MKKSELQELLSNLVTEALQSNALDPAAWYKPKKKPHYKKYRNSKLHPDEIEKKKEKGQIQQLAKQNTPFNYNEPGYEIPVNVRAFLNTTLQTLPKTQTSAKILQGLPVTKRDAMGLSRNLIAMPHFPYKQPRKLMNLLILLSIENAKE